MNAPLIATFLFVVANSPIAAQNEWLVPFSPVEYTDSTGGSPADVIELVMKFVLEPCLQQEIDCGSKQIWVEWPRDTIESPAIFRQMQKAGFEVKWADHETREWMNDTSGFAGTFVGPVFMFSPFSWISRQEIHADYSIWIDSMNLQISQLKLLFRNGYWRIVAQRTQSIG